MIQSREHLVLHKNAIFIIINYMTTHDSILFKSYSLYPDSSGKHTGWKGLDCTLIADILFIGF